MKKLNCGFTMVELLIVLAIVAILTTLAIPSFRTMLVKRTVQSVAQDLTTDIRFTRSEALRRISRVSICSLAESSTDTCSGAGSSAWKYGWMIFVDTSNFGVRDVGEEIIRVTQAPSNIASIESKNPSNDRRYLSFQPNGFARLADQTFLITPTGTGVASAVRLVCVSLQGRPSLRAEGVTACVN